MEDAFTRIFFESSSSMGSPRLALERRLIPINTANPRTTSITINGDSSFKFKLVLELKNHNPVVIATRIMRTNNTLIFFMTQFIMLDIYNIKLEKYNIKNNNFLINMKKKLKV